MSSIRRLVLPELAGAAVIAGGIAAPMASANTQASINCNWHPANNSGAPGGWNGAGDIRGGAHLECAPERNQGFPGDQIYMHCQHVDGNHVLWVYLTDYHNKETGWVTLDEVDWQGGALKQC
jgi:hypothetical protein